MTDPVIGVLAIALGLLLCLRGQQAFRFLLAVWGAIVGFGVGADGVDRYTDQGYLDSPTGWLVALVCALVFAALAFLYYAVGVVLALAAMGFVIAVSAASALGVDSPNLVLAAGIVGGIGLGLLAIAARLPHIVLIVVSSLAGAALVVGGILLLLNETSTLSLDLDASAQGAPSWATPVTLVLAVASGFVQLRSLAPARRPSGEDRA